MGWLRVRLCVLGAAIGGLAVTGCASIVPAATAPPTGSAVGPSPTSTVTAASSKGRATASTSPTLQKPKASAATGGAPASALDDVQPFSSLSAIAFPSVTHGVLLTVHCDAGSARCAVDAFTSADAGLLWSAPTVLASFTRRADANPYASIASHLTFVDETTGYAYGPDLFRTMDGGRSWQRLAASGSVRAVVPFDGRTWVVRSPCPPDSAGISGCGSLIDVLGEGDALKPLAAQPSPGGTVVQVVATSTETVYATVRIGETFGLRVSTDAGARWASLPLPCPPSQADGIPASLAAAGGRLWMVCGGDMGGGAENKQLFTSMDGGHTWRQPGKLETVGYADHVVAISATTAWRFGARAHAYLTTDGGRTWTPRLPAAFSGAFGAPNGWAFVGAERAWLLDGVGGYTTDPHHLYVSDDDGATWTTVTLPVGGP